MFTGRDTDVHAERQGSPMGIRLNMGYTGVKQNYSYLFQSMSGNSNLNFLSDYMSIKNGSYGKLMKAYYGKDSKISKEAASIVDEKKKTLSTSKDSAETLNEIQTASESWKSSAAQLTNTGKDDTPTIDKDAFAKANTYTTKGTYSDTYSSGNIFNSYF